MEGYHGPPFRCVVRGQSGVLRGGGGEGAKLTHRLSARGSARCFAVVVVVVDVVIVVVGDGAVVGIDSYRYDVIYVAVVGSQ